MIARASYYINMSPWVPRIWIEVWVGTYDRIRRPVNRYVPKIPPFQGGGNVIKLYYPGLGNRSIFYPGSSVGSTITPVRINSHHDFNSPHCDDSAVYCALLSWRPQLPLILSSILLHARCRGRARKCFGHSLTKHTTLETTTCRCGVRGRCTAPAGMPLPPSTMRRTRDSPVSSILGPRPSHRP